MANNYLEFSERLDNLTAEEEAWLTEQLKPIVVYGDREFADKNEIPDDLGDCDPTYEGPRFLRDNSDFDSSYDVLGFEFAFMDDQDSESSPTRYLWLHADCGNPDHVAWLIQKFLKRFRPDQCWSLTYAGTCSKPCVGEFGGGGVFVTANAIKCHDAGDFVAQERFAFGAAKSVRGVFDHILGENFHGETKPTEP